VRQASGDAVGNNGRAAAPQKAGAKASLSPAGHYDGGAQCMVPSKPLGADVDGVTEPGPPRDAFATFASWHRSEEFWRAIWSNALSALLAALVIYVIGAVSGVFSRQPLVVAWWAIALWSIGVVANAARNPRMRGRGLVRGVVGCAVMVGVAVFLTYGYFGPR